MTKSAVVVAVIASLSVAACGGSQPEPAAQPTPTPTTTPSPADAAAQAAQSMQQALQQMGDKTAKAVEFEQLIALLPEVGGWTRGKPKGEQVSMGITMSNAKAEYTKGDASIDLTITDSSFNQLVLSPFTMFLAAGYSERNSDGFKRSSSIAGHPGFESWRNDNKEGEVVAVVGNRFIVQAKGRDLENIDAVKALVQAVDFSKLSALK